MEYQEFLKSKLQSVQVSGFEVKPEQINPMLFKFQNAIVRWALRLGKSAVLAECGSGKTFMFLEWSKHVVEHTGGKVLILSPLAVAHQTVKEGQKLGIVVKYCKDQSEVDSSLSITNYDRLHLFDPSQFVGVVLDESSLLKSFMGKTKQVLIEAFNSTPYKLCCTATPAPNDHVELGNHAEFLGIKKQTEMLATWFVNDAANTGTWRLKKHATKDFWRWLTSWAVCMSKPGDLGAEYDMDEFVLPPLELHEVRIAAPQASIDRAWADGMLMPDDSPSSTGMHKVKRESLNARVAEVRKILDEHPDELFIIWCDTDYEADALIVAVPEAIEVRGSQKSELKEKLLNQFSDNEARMIISKPDLAGFGLNWQHCPNQIMVGVSYSFEKFYQAIRRSYRFGQKSPVNVWMIYAETEGNIMVILKHKQGEFSKMQAAMNKAVQENGLFRDADKLTITTGSINTVSGDNWTAYQGDCIEQIHQILDNSIGLSVYSPPFADLFVYSDSIRDMGNSMNDDQFFEQYTYLIPEMLRVTMPGRLSVVHCADLPSFKYKHGHTGLRDFPGEIIRAHIEAGWIYHSKITIWKSPVTEMTRTKAHALLHKNFTAKAEQVRQGIPDYLVIFRKPDPNDEGVHVTQHREVGDYIGTEPPGIHDYSSYGKAEQVSYSIAVWQRYASPVWLDIDQTRTLNGKLGRETDDAKHMCPLQLDVIERCIDLWSNKGDTIFTPFMGVGSEVVSAVKMSRKGIGIELKQSYFDVALRFIQEAELELNRPSLFDLMPEEA